MKTAAQQSEHQPRDSYYSLNKTLLRVSNLWEKRAKVRNHSLENELSFDRNKKDFLEDLLPFHKHPLYCSLAKDDKNRILSAGWLAYNEKNIDIENYIVSPTCLNIYKEHYPGVQSQYCKRIANETITDEAYHVLLTNNSSNITRKCRNLDKIKIKTCNLVQQMRKHQENYHEAWKKNIILLVTAIVSEVFICGYLRKLAASKTIQPINMQVARVHVEDEMAHGFIFRKLAKLIYSNLNRKQKDFFSEKLHCPISWFVDKELDVWESLLSQLKIRKYQDIINDVKEENKILFNAVDYTSIIDLANELGISNFQVNIAQ